MDMLKDLLSAVSPLPDGDMVDRLNYCYTTTMLVVFAIFVGTWNFVGKPIQCWFPAYYKGWWIEYATDYCFVQNTYFLPFTETPADNYWDIAKHVVEVPKNVTEREEKLLGYYQWVPFVLAIEAILFYLPVAIWRGMYGASGVKVKAICDTCNIKSNMAVDDRRKNMDVVARFLTYSNQVSASVNTGVGRVFSGRYISSLYLFIKFMFAVNCIVQFFMLQAFLRLENFWWGFDVLVNLARSRDWPVTGNFPRVTMCDFQVRVLGNLHRHTVQCVLMINMFNEKIFLFLWWWFLLVSIFSIISFIYWLATTLSVRTGESMVANYIEQIDAGVAHSPQRRQLVREFVHDHLKSDGVFLLRLIASNSGDLVTSQLLSALWQQFREDPKLYTSESRYPTLPMPPPYSGKSMESSEDSEPLLIGSKSLAESKL